RGDCFVNRIEEQLVRVAAHRAVSRRVIGEREVAEFHVASIALAVFVILRSGSDEESGWGTDSSPSARNDKLGLGRRFEAGPARAHTNVGEEGLLLELNLALACEDQTGEKRGDLRVAVGAGDVVQIHLAPASQM